MKRAVVASVASVAVILAVACHGKAEFPYQHRAIAEACPEVQRPPSPPSTRDGGAGPDEGCSVDADCTTGKHPRCVAHGHVASRCSSDECATDADCAAGKTCSCDEDGNRCVSSNCRTDAECGGRGCSPWVSRSCSGSATTVGYYCHTPKDSCTDSNDCSGATSGCEYSPEDGRWICVDHGRCVG